MNIAKHEGRHWGFGYLRVHSEKKVEAMLESVAIPHYLPTMPKARLHHSTKIISYIPMIPGYIFLCVSDQERSDLRRKEERFVHIELLRDEYQEAVFIRELNMLMQCERLALEAPILVNPDIVKGNEVMVTSGSLAGLTATVVARDDERNVIIINLTILDCHIEYPVSVEMLKKITA